MQLICLRQTLIMTLIRTLIMTLIFSVCLSFKDCKDCEDWKLLSVKAPKGAHTSWEIEIRRTHVIYACYFSMFINVRRCWGATRRLLRYSPVGSTYININEHQTTCFLLVKAFPWEYYPLQHFIAEPYDKKNFLPSQAGSRIKKIECIIFEEQR